MDFFSTKFGEDSEYGLRPPLHQRIAVLAGAVIPPACLDFAIYHYWGRGVGWLDMAILWGMYLISASGITIGFHRLFTHRAFQASPITRFVLGAMGALAMQGNVIKWCAIHRRHHQCSDRSGDPHSPHQHTISIIGVFQGFWHAHLGWVFENDPPELKRSVRDLIADPVVAKLDKLYGLWVLIGFLLPAGVAYAAHHTMWAAASGFFWGGPIRIFVQHNATFSINSICHIWGTRPYRSSDYSRNNPVFGVFSLGEGWHNNHHAFPTSARHGLEWWQLDISWMVIRTLAALGLAWDVRLPSTQARRDKRANSKIAKSNPPERSELVVISSTPSTDPV
jgi:stearoyl-CoA desaturase (delta-9 desaturase)